uniref:Uncharacterized protein n=1 Tax=Candidatus Kentrum sp. LFY TaxID=2126342 RepID=A0A450WB50_9GAMM|nr:MAG: hypothetical protein BECKLFY1418C_GA0070996_100725 [Candidatus Kentron sp. LFY]
MRSVDVWIHQSDLYALYSTIFGEFLAFCLEYGARLVFSSNINHMGVRLFHPTIRAFTVTALRWLDMTRPQIYLSLQRGQVIFWVTMFGVLAAIANLNSCI